MTEVYEYDVFISFASSDEQMVRPLWQELSSNGLRVFWSDATLRKELGNSWSTVIETSLENSRHLLLIWSPASIESMWVQRESRAFLDHCYKPGVRRLIPVIAPGSKINDLPLFMRELEAVRLSEIDMQEMISLLGGVNIDQLRFENKALQQDIKSLSLDKLQLESEINELRRRLEQDKPIKNSLDEGTDSSFVVGGSTPIHAFELLGLPDTASSQDIYLRYSELKAEYTSLLDICPSGLRKVCNQRLENLEAVYAYAFVPAKQREEERLANAYELLQLPKGNTYPTTLRRRYQELRAACQKAMTSSDSIIKTEASKELERLKEAFLILSPKGFVDDKEPLTEVVMPQMGESIAEGTITKWLKDLGDYVDRDEPLFEISTDKVDAEIPSPAKGFLREILHQEGETVEVNTVVALLEGDWPQN